MLKFSIIANLALIVISILLTFKAFPNKKRKIINFLTIPVFAVPIFFVIYVIYAIFAPCNCSISCKSILENEAESISALIASYFAEPDHTNLPTINDLEQYEGYTPPNKRKNNSRVKNLKTSDLIVFTRKTPNDEFEVWVVAGKGKCPAGIAYVKKMGDESGEWYKGYE